MYSHSRDGGDLLLHVLVVGHAGLAVGPVLEARLHEGDGLMGKRVATAGMLKSKTHFFQSLFTACIGINVFLSVFIHISAVYGPYVEPNKRVVQYPLRNF